MNNDGLSLQPGHRCGCDLNATLSWIVSIARMPSTGSRSRAATGGARFQWRSPADADHAAGSVGRTADREPVAISLFSS